MARKVEATLIRQGVRLTLGGEPTYVPLDPVGSEWSFAALGPTKLRYAYALADALVGKWLPNSVVIYSPGKTYPGEGNPRWALNLIWRRDGARLFPAPPVQRQNVEKEWWAKVKSAIARRLRVKDPLWLRAVDLTDVRRPIWVLPLDHDGRCFLSGDWALGARFDLLTAQGPAGLRLPLALVPDGVTRRALVLELRETRLHIFLPPLRQAPFLQLLTHLGATLRAAKGPLVALEGYIPEDEAALWTQLAIAADPGVLEVNLPPCGEWREYDRWITMLADACATVGLRSFKKLSGEEQTGTGGGNHLLFGGVTLESNPFFTRAGWLASILRYWQHHPSLSYLFTGVYVGASSQAPRPDESLDALYDLEMAYRFLEQLPPGDQRYLISETLRHLHTDGSGNTHRSETSFDKFWNVSWSGGCRGLLEFRALESLPSGDWMSAVALLWRALAAHLLVRPFTKALIEHGERLHDFYFLPECLWNDFETVLRDLHRSGLTLPPEPYREIVEWRFPTMLAWSKGDATLTIRKAHEGWPLLSETPIEGGNTSRFVDTSMERLELLANRAFARECSLRVQGRRLELLPFPNNCLGCGVRYRRSALHPSLHPGTEPQMPLHLSIEHAGGVAHFQLESGRRLFLPAPPDAALPRADRKACRRLRDTLLTYDLRLR